MGPPKLAICPEGYFDITSPCSFAFLRTVIPLSFLVVFALSYIPIPYPIRRLFAPYSIIFYDQASLKTLAPSNIIIKRKGPEVWRQALFVGLAAMQAVLWMGGMGAEIATFITRPWKSSALSSWPIWSSAATAMIWIFLTLQPLFYPTRKPRLSTIILYFTELILYVMSLATFAFEAYVTREIPSWVTARVIAMDVIGVVTCVTLIGLVMGLRLEDDELVHSVNAEAEDNTTLFQWVTFSWVDPLIKLGASKDLTDAEVPNLSPTQTTATSFNLLQAMTGSKLLHRIVKANAFDLFMDAVGTVIASFCAFLSPYFIKQILEGISAPNREKVATAYIYTCLAFGVSIIKALVDVQHLWYGRRASVRIKNQMIAAVYDKALRRKDASGVIAEKEEIDDKKGGKDKKVEMKKSSDSGRVVNLMASDANNVANTISGMYWVYGAPVQIVFALAFLYSLLGWSALAGVSTMIFMAPLNRWFASRSQALSAARSKATDRRIQVMNEIISAIRVIKFFAWTSKYRGKAAEARKTELDWSIKQMWNSMGYILVWTTGPLLVSTISFALFILVQKGNLTVSVAFTSVSLFAQLRQPLTVVPTFYQMILRALVSLKRMDDFLDEDEVEDWVSSLKAPQVSPEEAADTKIGFEHASFRWNTGVNAKAEEANKTAMTNGDGNVASIPPPAFELSDLDVIFPTGKLSVISGPTGSGKSAMLAALLGEMDCISGRSFLPKYPQAVNSETGLKNSIAYASQTAWLQNMSIKLNILFGEPLDEERYQATVKACALQPDYDALDDGDDTEIGSKGLALSGGQKARVALARAVYSHTQHVLLDDILAAVDSHTGRHLYERCLKGPLLKGRTIILVTHHLELLLPGTDYLVQINDGRIEQQGTPADLRKQGVLNRLVALEEASLEKHEAILTKDEVDKEVVAVADGEAAENGDSKPAKKDKVARKLVQDEDRATGHVEWAAYKLYLEASGWIIWIICVVLLVMQQGSNIGERLWLSVWSSAYTDSFRPLLFTAFSATRHVVAHDAHHDGIAHQVVQQAYGVASFQNVTMMGEITAQVSTQWPSAQSHPGYYLGIYTAITFGGVILGLLQSINSFLGGLKACRKIHDGMLENVMGSTIRFFDTTPAGRIINRFSRDIETIDGSLTSSLRTVLMQVATLIGSLALVASIVPAFLLPAAFISYGYYRLSVVYLSCTRDLRRIEATKRSPIFSGFAELLDGITIVRAFGVEREFRSTLFKQVDGAQGAFYHMWMANRWLLVRMDSLGATSVFFTSILALAGAVPAGMAGVAILSAQQFVDGCYWISRFWGGLEQDFNSVERAKTYLELPQEPPSTIEDHRPPAYWPSNTTTNSFLTCEKVSIKYAPDLPNVINKVSFDIKAREKIGLLGRTGSGKSTMAMALLRFVDPAEGRILIDGIDITTIGVDDLRSRITYIPQEAVLFSGTVRENLDPFNEHDDDEMLEALQAVHLRTTDTPAPSRVPSGLKLSALAEEEEGVSKAASTVVSTIQSKVTLDTEVASGGSNFSQGQRQLLAMARALLRRSNLVIADEATASIDFATDEAIQSTIRTGFKDACVLTIAHRISSVIDYDRLLVLSGGELAEFDTPINLLRKDGSVFKSLCEQSGRYQELYKAAEAAEKAKASK